MSQNLFDITNRNFETYYQQNKTKPWYQWLTPLEDEKSTVSNGKQGWSGILAHPHNKKMCCLYKVSKEDDNLVEHEKNILEGLETLSSYCPHFHKMYGIIPFECNVRLDDKPLLLCKKKKKIVREMLIMQYINNRSNFRELIEDEELNVKDDVVINIMKQIYLIIEMCKDYKFTHYDLHTENILIRDCNPNSFILYIIHNKLYFLPTWGFIPNVIDFGFSYIGKPMPLTCTLVHTKHGFTSSRFDPYSDLKLFTISIVDDLSRAEDIRKELYNKMSNICRNIFEGMNIQWSSGWDNSKIIDPVTLLHELVKEYVKNCSLFYNLNIWIDSIQQLINLPISPLPYHELETSCKTFVGEFVKFEERISSKTLLNYVLRIFVKYVKQYRGSYISSNPDESKWAVLEIKRNFLEEYTQIIKYHLPDIDYEKMICSILLLAQCMEGLFYEQLQKRFEEKDRQYELMKLKQPIEFYKVLDINFPVKEKKQINQKSNIMIVDHDNKKSVQFSLTKEEFQLLNKIKSEEEQTKFIYNIYKSR